MGHVRAAGSCGGSVRPDVVTTSAWPDRSSECRYEGKSNHERWHYSEGLDYQLDRAKPGNTFDAHRLIHLAAAHNLQAQAKERLLRAYFTEGLPISDHDTLATIGSELGLADDEVRTMLASDAYADNVRADEQRAAAFGIRGVPFYVIDEQYGVSGAQAPAVFLDALEQAWAVSHPLTLLSAPSQDDASCDDGSCVVTPARDIAEYSK